MGEIVNLQRARKARARREREAQADANRRRFGRTKVEKTADRAAETRATQALDGKRLDDGDEDDSNDEKKE
ncbi:MAG: DUF4169 family protein [Reyranella sp.]|jgi:hypothetical protein|uniref:DUF4169 family protein n=1 Tax=Reyranella sp. TaxID=1929291 RepID=UPI00095C938A|nr:DUF4169 family protein [Reyranella sp.]MBN9537392.1 DUF4169 family protein [Alphaproteobacteria bacterium]MBR2813917.1 DUF4169 family protein [Reyranella sp.]OJU47000.1 MAG: DUF4169 domain-containing protein [Alphaproteobacteria bacterium 65-37]